MRIVRGGLFHVAIAIEVGSDLFYTFDKDQAKLAKKVGFSSLPEGLMGGS